MQFFSTCRKATCGHQQPIRARKCALWFLQKLIVTQFNNRRPHARGRIHTCFILPVEGVSHRPIIFSPPQHASIRFDQPQFQSQRIAAAPDLHTGQVAAHAVPHHHHPPQLRSAAGRRVMLAISIQVGPQRISIPRDRITGRIAENDRLVVLPHHRVDVILWYSDPVTSQNLLK